MVRLWLLLMLLGIPALGFYWGGWIGLIIGIAIAAKINLPTDYN